MPVAGGFLFLNEYCVMQCTQRHRVESRPSYWSPYQLRADFFFLNEYCVMLYTQRNRVESRPSYWFQYQLRADFF
jgi:hypothetical protein